jgi:hypothetical protein
MTTTPLLTVLKFGGGDEWEGGYFAAPPLRMNPGSSPRSIRACAVALAALLRDLAVSHRGAPGLPRRKYGPCRLGS